MFYLRLKIDPKVDFDRGLYKVLQGVPSRSRGTFLKIFVNDLVARYGASPERTRALLESIEADPAQGESSEGLKTHELPHSDDRTEQNATYTDRIADANNSKSDANPLSEPVANRTIEPVGVLEHAAADGKSDANLPDLSNFEA